MGKIHVTEHRWKERSTENVKEEKKEEIKNRNDRSVSFILLWFNVVVIEVLDAYDTEPQGKC